MLFSKEFSWGEFDGFETTVASSKYGDYEYLYLIKAGRREIIISEFYHSNYFELKNFIEKKVMNLGYKPINLIAVFKEIFRGS